jgi:folate/biopterin transporter
MSGNEKTIERNKLAYIIISFTQGISTIVDLAIQYYFKDLLLLEPAQMALIFSFLMIPWMIKPLLGLLTDLVPIFGYRRKIYIMICGLISCLSMVSLAYFESSIYTTIICLFGNSFALSFSSVLGEAIVVELCNIEFEGSHEMAKNYVSLFFLFKNCGILLASFFKGYLMEILTIREIFLLSSIIPFFTFFAGVIFIEQRLENFNYDLKNTLLDAVNKLELEKIQKKDLLKDFYEFLTKKEAYIPALYVIFLFCTPDFSNAFFYYMTNVLEFSPLQLGVISLASTIGVLLAIISYRRFFKNCRFRVVVTYSTFLYFIFSFIATLLVTRYNIILGISDFNLCMFGFTFLSILAELSMMPILTLACMICPRSLEGTVYSFFMSALNLGQCLSILFGSFLTSGLKITSHNFANFGTLILICNISKILPILGIYLINEKYLEPSLNENIVITKNIEYIMDEEEILNNPNENIKKIY